MARLLLATFIGSSIAAPNQVFFRYTSTDCSGTPTEVSNPSFEKGCFDLGSDKYLQATCTNNGYAATHMMLNESDVGCNGTFAPVEVFSTNTCKQYSGGSYQIGCFGFEFPCFAADSVVCRVSTNQGRVISAEDAYTACFVDASANALATRAPMSALAAGDLVLSEADGKPFITRVVVNQHAASPLSSRLLHLNHEHGTLSLTGDHVLHLNGVFAPAREAKEGDLLVDAKLSPTKIKSISASYGLIANPITANGKILAASAEADSSPVIAATANEWLADVLLSAYPQYTLSFVLAAAFPLTVQAYYDSWLEPMFNRAVPHLAAMKAALPSPFVAIALVLGDMFLAGGLATFALLSSLKYVLSVALIAGVLRRTTKDKKA